MALLDMFSDDPNSLQAAQNLGLAAGLLSGRGGPALGAGIQNMMGARKDWQDRQMEQLKMGMAQAQFMQQMRQMQAMQPIYDAIGQRFAGGSQAQQPGMSASGAPTSGSVAPGSSMAPGSSPGGSGGMFGLSNDALAGAVLAGPQKMGEAIIDANKATDMQRMLRANNIDPNSVLGQQILQQAIAKANYIAPTSLRPGGYVQQPNGDLQNLPHVPDGFQAVKDAGGNWQIVPVNGALGALGASAQIQAAARNSVEPASAFDPNTGVQVNTNKTALATGGGVPGANGAPASGAQAAGVDGLDVSRLSPAQAAFLRQQDPQAFANGMERFISTGGVPGATQAQQSGNKPLLAAAPAGFQESQADLAKANAQRYNGLIAQAADSPTRQNVYDNIINLSKQGVQTGPGQDWKNNIKGYIANAPGISSVAKNWQNDVAGFQELNKFMYQNAQRNWQAAGGTGTDSQLEAFSKANPNDKMFPSALQAMAQWGKAGELALMARTNAMQNFKDANNGNVANLDQFDRQWRNSFDPVLFQLKTMEPAQAQAYVGNLKMKDPAAYNALMQKAQALKSMGGL